MEIKNNDEFENSKVVSGETPDEPEAENEIAGEEPAPTEVSEGKALPVTTVESPFMRGLKKFGKSAWAYIKHAKMELIVIAALIVIDLVTKAIVAKHIPLYEEVYIIPKFLYFTYTTNDAAAFGGLFGLEKVMSPLALRILLIIITTIAIGVFCYLMYRFKDRHKLMRLSLALILAGAVGNYVDRLFLGEVRDFIGIEYFGKSCFGQTGFAIFNIADAALTIGVIIFIIYFIFFFKDTKSKKGETKNKTEAVTEAAEEEPTEQAESKHDSAEDTVVEISQTVTADFAQNEPNIQNEPNETNETKADE